MKWFKNRRKALIRDIANEVMTQLENRRGWKKFLPPVAMRDTVYMMTEDGTVYGMKQDFNSNMEVIYQIKVGL